MPFVGHHYFVRYTISPNEATMVPLENVPISSTCKGFDPRWFGRAFGLPEASKTARETYHLQAKLQFGGMLLGEALASFQCRTFFPLFSSSLVHGNPPHIFFDSKLKGIQHRNHATLFGFIRKPSFSMSLTKTHTYTHTHTRDKRQKGKWRSSL